MRNGNSMRELQNPLAGDYSDAIPIAPEQSLLRGTAPQGLSDGRGSPPRSVNGHHNGDKQRNGQGSGGGATLKKNLKLIHCLAMSITMIAPTPSIYLMSGQIAQFAGASAPFVILLSTAVSLCLAFSVLQFSEFVSTSGSFFSFISVGLGPEAGVMAALLMMCGYGLLGIQALLGLAAWFADVVQRNAHVTVHWAYFAAAFVVIIAGMAYLGMSQSLTVSLVMAAAEAVVIFIFAVLLVKDGGAEGNTAKAFGPTYSAPGNIAHAMVFGTLVFCGFEGAAALGEETENPKQNIGRAVVGSVLFTALYMCFGVYAMIVGQGPSHATDLANVSAASDLFARRYISDWFAVLVDLAGCTATYTVTVGNWSYNFRLLYSFGRRGLLGFGMCGRTHPERQTPVVAIVVFSLVAAAGAFATGLLAGTGPSSQNAWTAYGWLGYVGTLPIITIYMATQPALYVFMRKHHPHRFSVWKHALLPAVTFLLYLVPLIGNFWPNPPVSPFNYMVYGLLGWIVLSACVVLYYRRVPGTLDNIAHLFDAD